MLVKDGKMLDDLATMGYEVAELAEWVGPTSAEVPQDPQGVPHTLPQPPQGVPQGGGQVPQRRLRER